MKDFTVVKSNHNSVLLLKNATYFIYRPLSIPFPLLPSFHSTHATRTSFSHPHFLPITELILSDQQIPIAVISPAQGTSLAMSSRPTQSQIMNTLEPLMEVLYSMSCNRQAHQCITPQNIIYHEEKVYLADHYVTSSEYKPESTIAKNLAQLAAIFQQLKNNSLKSSSQPFSKQLNHLLSCMAGPLSENAFRLAAQYSSQILEYEQPSSNLNLSIEQRQKALSTYSPPVVVKRSGAKYSPISAKRAMAEDCKRAAAGIVSLSINSKSSPSKKSKKDDNFRITLLPTQQHKKEEKDKSKKMREQERFKRVMQMSNTFLNEIKNSRQGVTREKGSSFVQQPSERKKLVFEQKDKSLINKYLKKVI